MIVQRSNTILYCRWWADTVAFYRDEFGFEITHQTEWFVEFKITNNAFLSIADETRARINSVKGQGITLSWQVENIKDAHGQWSEKNIPITPIKHVWGSLAFYLHDPEGHRIELWQPVSSD